MSEVMTYGRAYDYKGGVAVKTTRPPLDNLSDEVMVIWQDNRHITPEQRRKAWALMTEIAAFQGQDKEDTYAEQRSAFTLKHLETLQDGLFHLSTATVTTARAFITMLVEIIIEYGIPTKEPLYGLCDDIERYVYACLMNKKCAVCGRKAEIHHCEGSTVGMGRNRKTMVHLGLELMPLCREHHRECHDNGQTAFNSKYHLIGIPADEKICKKAGLKYAD
jgi:hypothetical protein